jgi:hypothetical protein
MKPIVVYINENNDKISLTKEKFEQFLKEAYDQGYSEGYSKGMSYNHSSWWRQEPMITYTTGTPSINRDTITCSSSSSSNIVTNDTHRSLSSYVEEMLTKENKK